MAVYDAVMLIAHSIGGAMGGPIVGTLCPLVAVLGVLAVGWLGALCRESLPRL